MKAEGVRKIWARYKFAVLILLAGAGLLLWPGGSGATQGSGQNAEEPTAPVQEMQTEMEAILSHISGVGSVQVMLTVDSDGERQLAQDTQLQYRGSTAAPEDYSRSSQPVLLDGDGREEVVVTRRLYPTYRGALVVCQGGDRAEVRLAVTEAVSALTGLSSDRVTVAKCP